MLGPQETVSGQCATSTVSDAAAGPTSGVVEQLPVPPTGGGRKELLHAITNVLAILDDEGTPMWNAGLRCTVDPSEPSGEGKMFDPEPRLRVSAFFVVMTALLTNAIQYPHNKKLSDP